MSPTLIALKHSFRLLGPGSTIALILEKRRKQKAYEKMLAEVRASSTIAVFNGFASSASQLTAIDALEREKIVARANAMLRDENLFFTFPYALRRIQQPWNYDPIEATYWPKRHYTEVLLHAPDTPRDVKIVWEINRFKDLPILAQAASLTGDTKYRDEIEHRMLSWIEDNPLANSINWASALEIGIRLLSWTTSIALLNQARMTFPAIEAIGQSVWQHARYLAQDLSVDKVVRSNHLIGEVAALFVVAHSWRYPEALEHRSIARRILEKEILEQTYADGSTKESATWYHQFVTHFFQIVERVAANIKEPMNELFLDRLTKMESFLEALCAYPDRGHPQDAPTGMRSSPETDLVRIGDGDDGWAIYFEGDRGKWIDVVFGSSLRKPKSCSLFPIGGYAGIRAGNNYAAMRAGPFGMGGDGFSSHAHDDCLSPILFLDGVSILVDPGTYVYNGAPEKRSEYRGINAHNGVTIGDFDHAEQKLNFGWKTVRMDASLIEAGSDDDETWCSAAYGETKKWHTRRLALSGDSARIVDRFEMRKALAVTWRFHLLPEWKVGRIEADKASFTHDGRILTISAKGQLASMGTESYNYSPSYLREEQAVVLVAKGNIKASEISFEFEIGPKD